MIDIKINKSLPPIQDGQDVAIDLEMFGQDSERLHIPHGTFACLSFAVRVGEDIHVRVITNKDQAMQMLRDVDKGLWIFHNAYYDIKQLQRFIDIPERLVWDTMLVERVLWNGYYNKFSLNNLVRRYFNYYMSKEIRSEFEFATEMSAEQINYAGRDAMFTLMIKEKQQSLGRNLDPYWKFEVSSLWTAMRMQPVKIDVDAWSNALKEFQQEVDTIQKRIGVNSNSYKKVREKLEKDFGIIVPSTGEEVLRDYIDHPFVQDILLSRRYRKAISSYGEKWYTTFLEEGNLIRANWNSIGTETFRWSCNNPPLQTVPARKLPIYRTFFIPQLDTIFVTDVSQQEPRITAFLSQDKNLIGIFDRGEDIHSGVAQAIYKDKSIAKGDPRRSVGKEINLAIGYGITAPGLMQSVNSKAEDSSQKITLAEAEDIINLYFSMFPGVREYIQDYRNFAATHGYVEAVGGHRIYINPYNASAENNAINAPIQTTAAEITKRWTDVSRQKLEDSLGRWPGILIVHDEMVLDLHNEELEEVIQITNETLQEVNAEILPGIPVECEYEYGDSWGVKS